MQQPLCDVGWSKLHLIARAPNWCMIRGARGLRPCVLFDKQSCICNRRPEPPAVFSSRASGSLVLRLSGRRGCQSWLFPKTPYRRFFHGPDAIRVVRPRSRLMVSFRSLGIIGPGKDYLHSLDRSASLNHRRFFSPETSGFSMHMIGSLACCRYRFRSRVSSHWIRQCPVPKVCLPHRTAGRFPTSVRTGSAPTA